MTPEKVGFTIKCWSISNARGSQDHARQFKVVPGALVLPDAPGVSSVDCRRVSFFYGRWHFGVDEIMAGLSEASEPGDLEFRHGCQLHRPAADFLSILFCESQKRAMTRQPARSLARPSWA
ncbi:MAG TPA: hypothetical protein VJW77_08805 [Terriglobia bacterium]|nr:hypothetical protein [Terriglobia bacterium]